MKLLTAGAAFLLWWYLLGLLKRAKLDAWRFFAGVAGVFLFLLLLLRPLLRQICTVCVCTLAGLIGQMSHTFTVHLQYGVLHVPTAGGAVTLLVNFECSGVAELAGYLSLVSFYPGSSRWERWGVGVAGRAYILVANGMHLILIAELVHFLGPGVYDTAHVFIGRIFFYGCSILLYYVVFTRRQVVRLKVGVFP
ncbi:MAG: exosortase family protein XrtG [Oscillospiraceae bacterium]|nr:exosortase family protein XrtG [Oscillospiraceae bacterium]